MNSCLVLGCKDNHQSHYCKNCKDKNSDHFSSKCPNLQGQQTQQTPRHCQVNDCKEYHEKHYCKNCQNEDSDHFSRNCPNPQQQNNGNSTCQAKDCTKNHSSHFCRLCKSKNSDHISRNCPKGISKYHGTKIDCLKSIINNGLRPSAQGRIGPGIYLADKDVAKKVALHRGGQGLAVFKLRFFEDKCKKDQHPTWKNVTTGPFTEWCLQTDDYVIEAVYCMNGELTEKIYAPHIDLIIGGDFKIKVKNPGFRSIGTQRDWDKI